MQGLANYTNDEALEVVGRDRESAQKDLFDNIEQGNFPKWRMCVQVMQERDAATCPANPFDVTKVWPHKDYPLIEVGILELNRNPENYFAEVEQAAFTPANVVPGIGFSPDKMLQGRLFSYGDAARYRLGVNHHQIPVNAPRCPFHNSVHRDGAMRTDGNLDGRPNYEPNRFGEFAQDRNAAEPALALYGAADRFDHRVDDDYYSQPGALFRLMTDAQKQQLFNNIAASIASVPDDIKHKQIEHFTKADPAYGAGVTKALDFPHRAPNAIP
jgi:catalase